MIDGFAARNRETSAGRSSGNSCDSSGSSWQFNTKLDAKGNVESHGRRRGRSLVFLLYLFLLLLARLLRFDDSGGGQGDTKLGISSPGTRFEF